ncbi:hypothetical protein ACFLVC_01965 [Chloroflexota bacterium]
MNIVLPGLDTVREPYRALLTVGRTYAAFKPATTIPLIERLRDHDTIADPMAGFGTLMNLCSQRGISTFNIEYNPPTYLWGFLNNPRNTPIIMDFIDHLLRLEVKFPEMQKKAEISDEWFTPTSLDAISHLYGLLSNLAPATVNLTQRQDIILALVIPFVGRLSCHVPGNIVANVKRGGICFYRGLSDDFNRYLQVIKARLNAIDQISTNNNHEFLFGNLKTINPARRLSAFITSPPYPNSRDYYQMFAPENNCLEYLKSKKIIVDLTVTEQLIGSVLVSKYADKNIDYHNQVSSESARTFIDRIATFEGRKRRSKYDNTVYYVPYFSNYFFNIEAAYRNFVRFLENRFEGYIVVVNNTARNISIPVAQSIIELFHHMGIEAETVEEYTRELSHVGSINPRVKGFKAKHMEYTIKVWRRT